MSAVSWQYLLAVRECRQGCGAAAVSQPISGYFEYSSGQRALAGAEGFEPSALGFGVSGKRPASVDEGRLRTQTVGWSRRQSAGLAIPLALHLPALGSSAKLQNPSYTALVPHGPEPWRCRVLSCLVVGDREI